MSAWPYQVPGTQIWPPPIDTTVPKFVTPDRALGIPGVARAVALMMLIGIMPMNAVKGTTILPRPMLLEQPQPEPGRDRSWWVAGQVRDYWLHGNAVHLVTSRYASGLPASVMWLPAERVTVIPDSNDLTAVLEYRFDGVLLPTSEIVHVRRGMDPLAPWRGIGAVEQHMSTFSRIADQESYETQILNGAAVPSIVVITPGETTNEQEEEAKKRWNDKFAGPKREPVFVPSGTEVKPLSWSPKDQQLTEARQLSLTDIANIANLDGYWLGASTTGYSYKSPGPMYLNLVRQTLTPIMAAFEGSWGPMWLPWGTHLKFDTQAVLGDDMETTVRWLAIALRNGLITQDEAREYIGKSPLPEGELPTPPVVGQLNTKEI